MSGSRNVRVIGDELESTKNVVVVGRKRPIRYVPQMNVELLGIKNKVNKTFHTPDPFVVNNHLNINVYWNGRRLSLNKDYFISESNGVNTGYDTVILTPWSDVNFLPRANDSLLADYYVLVK